MSNVRDAVPSIKPSVRSPPKTVCEVVSVGLPDVKTVNDGDGLAVGSIVAVLVRDEEELGRAKCPDAAETNFDARQLFAFIPKNSSSIRHAVLIGVLENDDAIALFWVIEGGRVSISIVFCNPESAAHRS